MSVSLVDVVAVVMKTWFVFLRCLLSSFNYDSGNFHKNAEDRNISFILFVLHDNETKPADVY